MLGMQSSSDQNGETAGVWEKSGGECLWGGGFERAFFQLALLRPDSDIKPPRFSFDCTQEHLSYSRIAKQNHMRTCAQ